MAKADIRPSSTLSPLIKESARRTHGKQETAARHLGKQPSNFSRDVECGDLRLRDLEALGGEFLAEFGKGLVETYAPLVDPKAEARRSVRDIEARLDTLRQFIEAT